MLKLVENTWQEVTESLGEDVQCGYLKKNKNKKG